LNPEPFFSGFIFVMHVPFQYQVSEYDCVPTALINAVSYLFERDEIPPMVIRHIFLYSLDTVGRKTRLGTAGTSRHAIRLLSYWLNAYKIKKFSVATEFIEEEDVHLNHGSKILACLEEGGVALCTIFLGKWQEHFLMLVKVEDGWVYCFDSYFRIGLRGLRDRVSILKDESNHAPNLKIRLEWMAQENEDKRFCLGPIPKRECLLMWRTI
jgi:hypothetical protein